MGIFRSTAFRVSAVPLLLFMSGCGGGESDLPAGPTATTTSVIPSPESAVVRGIVAPNGLPSDAWFEYGTDNTFSTFTKTADQPIPPGTEPVSIQETLNGLVPGVTYYYRVLAENEAGRSTGTVGEFFTPLQPVPTGGTDEASDLTATGATLNGTVNPNGLATDAWFEYGSDNTLSTFTKTADQPIPPGTVPVSIQETLTDLAAGATYYFRVMARNAAGPLDGTIESFATPLPAPTAKTDEATNLTATGTTLHGTVNPNGQAGTVWFEWGEAPEPAAFSTTATQPLSAGTGNQAVSADLVGLTPGATYYYRVATTTAGGDAVGAIESFTTPFLPTVTTMPATGIAVTEPTAEATLRGVVNPNGTVTRAWLEWGTDPSLSTFVSTTEQFLGSGTDNQAVAAAIAGLAAWSTYYFRVAAETGTGTGTTIVRGEIASFSAGEYYVAAGDSITRGSHDTVPEDDTSLDGRNNGGGFEPILNDLLTSAKAQLPHTVENEGVSGANSATGVAGIGDVLARHPEAKYFLVMYGTNDAGLGLASGRGLEPGDAGYANSYKDNMRQIIWAIEGAGKRPLLAKVPYTLDPLRDIALIQEYNDVVDELVAFHFIGVVAPDLFAHFQANPGELDDGTHPNGVGYRSMAALWRDALTP